jgi:hypothetical protein
VGQLGQRGSGSSGVFQAQTPPTFLDTNREAGYLAEIDRLQARLNIRDAQHAFSMQHVCAAQQNGSSEFRPRSHYCGLHGWNNDRNGTECRGMAHDKGVVPIVVVFHAGHARCNNTCGHGGNPKVGVQVGFVVRPSLFAASPFWPAEICLTSPSETCLTCPSPPCLLLSFSQVSSAKAKPAPYEDRRAPASPAVQSEGTNAALVRESAADVSVSLSQLPASLFLLCLLVSPPCYSVCLLFLFPCRSHRQGQTSRDQKTRQNKTNTDTNSQSKIRQESASRFV